METVPVLTWSPTHSRSQVLWASTHRLGLSWLGHTPGWLLGPGGRPAPKVSPTTRSSGSGLGASMGTAGPGGGGCDHQSLLRPCLASLLKASTFPGLQLLLLPSGPQPIPEALPWPPRSEPTADASAPVRGAG